MDNEEFQKLVEGAVLMKFGGTRLEYDLALAKVMDGWNDGYALDSREGFDRVFATLDGVDESPYKMMYGLYIDGYLMYDPRTNRLDIICRDNDDIHPMDGFSALVTGARISEPDEEGVRDLLLITRYVIGEPLNEVKG